MKKGEKDVCGIAGFYSSRHSYTQEGERWEKVLEGMNRAQKRVDRLKKESALTITVDLRM